MNTKATALAIILGLCAPALADLVINPQALADEPVATKPIGGFTDGLWTVALWFENNNYNYSLKNYQTGAAIFLADVQESVDSDRQIYTWSDGANQYQVMWQPSVPRTIRLQVIAPDGREILNRLLTRQFK